MRISAHCSECCIRNARSEERIALRERYISVWKRKWQRNKLHHWPERLATRPEIDRRCRWHECQLYCTGAHRNCPGSSREAVARDDTAHFVSPSSPGHDELTWASTGLLASSSTSSRPVSNGHQQMQMDTDARSSRVFGLLTTPFVEWTLCGTCCPAAALRLVDVTWSDDTWTCSTTIYKIWQTHHIAIWSDKNWPNPWNREFVKSAR